MDKQPSKLSDIITEEFSMELTTHLKGDFNRDIMRYFYDKRIIGTVQLEILYGFK